MSHHIDLSITPCLHRTCPCLLIRFEMHDDTDSVHTRCECLATTRSTILHHLLPQLGVGDDDVVYGPICGTGDDLEHNITIPLDDVPGWEDAVVHAVERSGLDVSILAPAV